MTAQRVPQLYYTPREAGGALVPPRSSQYILRRIWGQVPGEHIEAQHLPSGNWRVGHDEMRRFAREHGYGFAQQDLNAPGHEQRDERDEKMRELRLCVADIDAKLARVHQLVAELG